MARVIVEKHGINENQTAKILGLSQSAVSRYITRDRGNLIEIENAAEIQPIINQMVTYLIKEPEKKQEVMKLFCQACQKIRQKGLLCELCQKEMPKEWAQSCNFCQ
jgi:predicted transcriptional regulator